MFVDNILLYLIIRQNSPLFCSSPPCWDIVAVEVVVYVSLYEFLGWKPQILPRPLIFLPSLSPLNYSISYFSSICSLEGHLLWRACDNYIYYHGLYILVKLNNVYPRNLGPFYIVSDYINWVKTSWTDSTCSGFMKKIWFDFLCFILH